MKTTGDKILTETRVRYMHVHTGEMSTQIEWEQSYSVDELEDRSMTATEAFHADVGVSLFFIDASTS